MLSLKSKSDASSQECEKRLSEQILAIQSQWNDIYVAFTRMSDNYRSNLDGPRHQVVLPRDVVLEIFRDESVELPTELRELRRIGAAQLFSPRGYAIGVNVVVYALTH